MEALERYLEQDAADRADRRREYRLRVYRARKWLVRLAREGDKSAKFILAELHELEAHRKDR